MPYAIPQSQLYGARGRMADGMPIRNRGQEQFNTTSGNPGMPIFNMQRGPQQGVQTYGGQPTQLGYTTNMAPNGAVSAAQGMQNEYQQGNTNNFGTGIMPMFNNWNGGPQIRGNGMPPMQGMPQRGGPQPMTNPLMWQGHQVTQGQMSGIQSARDARNAWWAAHPNGITPTVSAPPPTTTLPIITNS